jgi:AraC-like DNA-binding protein
MMSLRSKREVKAIIENVGLQPVEVEIGEVEIHEKLSINNYYALKKALQESDFDLVGDKEIILIEKVKSLVIEMIYAEELPATNYSHYLSKKLKINYTYLSKFFSRVKKITIEQFIITHKIERVKQLLAYNELTLSQIALKLNYSSTAHLSAQFKKVTGITPSIFKKLKYKRLIPLECI